MQEKPEWEISLKSMLFYAAYRWKLILIVSLVLGIFLGCSQAMSIYNSGNSMSVQKQYIVEYTQYKANKRNLETSIEQLQKDVAAQEAYLVESMLMQLDHRDVHQASANLYLSTPYQILPQMSYQNTDKAEELMAFYSALLDDQLLLETIGRQVDLEAKYLKEIISTNAQLNHILTITVSWTDDTGAQAVLDALIAYIEDHHDILAEAVGEHTTTVVLNTVGALVVPSILERQEQENAQLETYEWELATKETELLNLVEPAPVNVSLSSAIKAGIKWFIVGCVAGAVVFAAFCCFLFIFSDKVFSAADLHARCGIRVLGSMSGRKKAGRVTRWLRRLEGRIVSEADDALLQETLRQYAGSAASVLVTGSLGSDEAAVYSARIQEGLTGLHLVAGGNLMEDAAAMRALSECDAVVLLEKCGDSRYHMISREIARIRDLNKPLLGCIIAER